MAHGLYCNIVFVFLARKCHSIKIELKKNTDRKRTLQPPSYSLKEMGKERSFATLVGTFFQSSLTIGRVHELSYSGGFLPRWLASANYE